MRRVSWILAGLALLLPALAMATGQPEPAAGAAREVTIRMIQQYSKDRIPTEVSYWEKLARQKFGIVFKLEQVPAQGIADALGLRFAAGDYPDLVENAGYIQDQVNRWGQEGHLIPLDPYLESLPDYKGQWSKKDWDNMMRFVRAADGHLYYLPCWNWAKYGQAWVYRKDLWDAQGLQFPQTLDELWNQLQKLAKAYPQYAPAFSTRGNGKIDSFMEGFVLAYRARPFVHIDVDTKQLVYGPATTKYLDALRFANKLYAAGMVDPEFLTLQLAQWQEKKYKQLKSYVEYSSNGNHVNFNREAQKTDSKVNWATSWTILKGDASKKEFYEQFPAWYTMGPFITRIATKDKIERLMQFFNWTCTDEGGIARYWGEPGVTMEYVKGEPRFLPHMYSAANPNGTQTYVYNLNGYFLRYYYPYWLQAVGDMADFYNDYYRQLEGKDFVMREPAEPWVFTPEETKELADLGVVLGDTYQSFGLKFILGDLDPNKDADINAYTAALQKAGLERYLAIYRKAYDRIPK